MTCEETCPRRTSSAPETATLGRRAVIDFGMTRSRRFNPQSAVGEALRTRLRRTQGCNMAYIGAGEPGESIWTTTQNASFADDFFGRSTFSISVTTKFGQRTHRRRPPGTSPSRRICKAIRRRPAAGVGPVEYLKITTLDPARWLRTQTRGTRAFLPRRSQSFIVTVGLRTPFQIESPLAAAGRPPRRKPLG